MNRIDTNCTVNTLHEALTLVITLHVFIITYLDFTNIEIFYLKLTENRKILTAVTETCIRYKQKNRSERKMEASLTTWKSDEPSTIFLPQFCADISSSVCETRKKYIVCTIWKNRELYLWVRNRELRQKLPKNPVDNQMKLPY